LTPFAEKGHLFTAHQLSTRMNVESIYCVDLVFVIENVTIP